MCHFTNNLSASFSLLYQNWQGDLEFASKFCLLVQINIFYQVLQYAKSVNELAIVVWNFFLFSLHLFVSFLFSRDMSSDSQMSTIGDTIHVVPPISIWHLHNGSTVVPLFYNPLFKTTLDYKTAWFGPKGQFSVLNDLYFKTTCKYKTTFSWSHGWS